MKSMELIGLNTKWYRYQKGITQEAFWQMTKWKMSYLSTIETGRANLTCKNIDLIVEKLGITPDLLFKEETALQAKKLPRRVDIYNKQKKNQEKINDKS